MLLFLSMTVSPRDRFPKSTPVPPMPDVPILLPELGVELSLDVLLSSLLIWSKPIRARIFSAAFFAELATPLLDFERLSAELAALSIPVLAPAAALPIAEICPEALLLDFLTGNQLCKRFKGVCQSDQLSNYRVDHSDNRSEKIYQSLANRSL